jgi:hypothetical protein
VIDQATYSAVLQRGTLVAVPRALSSFRVSQSQWSVDLVRTQAEQTIALSRELAAAYPGLLGRRHLLIGGLRARANAYGRRAVYRWLGRRMRVDAGTDGGQPQVPR